MSLSIGLFTYSTRPRGSVVHAASLAEALTELGHDVTLYALSKSGEPFYRALGARLALIPAEEAPADPDRLVAQRISEFVAGLAALRPRHDVHHAEDCLAANALVAARARPIVRTLHHVERFESAYLEACQRTSVEHADLVLSVSEATRRDVLLEFGRDAPSVQNGVDAARFDASLDAAIDVIRRRFDVKHGDVVVLSVGGVEPRKNSLPSLEAMTPVLAARGGVHWFVAGGASIWDHEPYRRSFAAQIDALPCGIRRRIHVTGPVDEAAMTALYQLADVLFFPSTQEGFGLAALEALAARTAVIVPRTEPFTEYLNDRVAAFVDQTSPRSMTDALTSFIDDPERRAAYASRGRTHAEVFTWRRSALLHAKHYQSVLDATETNPPSPATAAALAGDSTHA
jgi:glycosyltransferase-like protein